MSDPASRLTRAVHDGDIDTVKSFTASLSLTHSEEWPFDVICPIGYDLLCDAIQMGHTEIAKELISCVMIINEDEHDSPSLVHDLTVSNKNAEIVDIFLEQYVVINDHNYGKLLELVVDTENLKIAEQLIDCIAYVNSLRSESRFLGMIDYSIVCFSKECEEIVELFLSRNSEIPMNKAIKTSLLLFATQNDKPNLVKLLLELGADVNVEIHGKTVLQVAVDVSNFETIERILRFCPDINSKGNYRIIRHAMTRLWGYGENDNKILDALLEYGFIIHPEDANDGISLLAATQWGRFQIVKTLLNYGADVNAVCPWICSTPLHCAVCCSCLEIAEELIKHGADVNATNQYNSEPPIYYAVERRNAPITKLLLASGANTKDVRYNLLCEAVARKMTEIVEILIQYDTKCDINDPTYKDGTTVLLNIVETPIVTVLDDDPEEDSCKAKMVEICLSKGSIVDAKNNVGHTALYAAFYHGLFEVVEVLLKYGAKVDVTFDFQGDMTPLMIAIINNNFKIVEAILLTLPNIEIRDKHGKTALHYCIPHRTSQEIVIELLKYGVDLYIMCEDTPCTCALHPKLKMIISEYRTLQMQALHHNTNSQNSHLFDEDQDYYDECKDEVEDMKSVPFGDTIFSFHDMLTKDMHILAVYMKNRDVVDALRTRDFVKEYVNAFPIYFGMIYYRFKKAIELEPLLTPSAKSLDLLIGFTLPYPVTMKILGYLNYKVLKNLIKATTTD